MITSSTNTLNGVARLLVITSVNVEFKIIDEVIVSTLSCLISIESPIESKENDSLITVLPFSSFSF